MTDDRISDNKRYGIMAGMVLGAIFQMGFADTGDLLLNGYHFLVIVLITGGACIWLVEWSRMSEVVQPLIGEWQGERDENEGDRLVCTDSKKWVQWMAVWCWILWFTVGFVFATLATYSTFFSDDPSILLNVHRVFAPDGLHPIWQLYLAYEGVFLVFAIFTILTWTIKKVRDGY